MSKKRGFPMDSFFKVPNMVFGSRKQSGWLKHLGHIGLAVYVFILRRYNYQKQQTIYESHRTMAKRLNIARNTLEKHLAKLQKLGLISSQPRGRRRHPLREYVPVIPVPEPSSIGGGIPNGPTSRPINQPVTERLAQPVGHSGALSEPQGNPQPVDKKVVNPGFDPPKRLYKRLNIYMYLEKEVEEVASNEATVPLKQQVQLAWKYWCMLWEKHYNRTYYLASASDTSKTISKDKRNLRVKITAVGFKEVTERMRRCLAICDDMFPCKVKGKWQRPIAFNDFIGNHFFDQWIAPAREATGCAPKATADKVKDAMKKRAGRVVGNDGGEEKPKRAVDEK